MVRPDRRYGDATEDALVRVVMQKSTNKRLWKVGGILSWMSIGDTEGSLNALKFFV